MVLRMLGIGRREERARDPVCGMQVAMGSRTPQARYQGATYYFCCLHCKSEFERNPQEYVRVGSDEEQPPAG